MLVATPDQPKGLQMDCEPDGLRFFRARFRPFA